MKPRAITGLGVLSALGAEREEVFAKIRENVPLRSRPRPASQTLGEAYAGAGAYEIPDFTPQKYLGEKGLRLLDRLTRVLICTARIALADAGIKQSGAFLRLAPEDVGLVCSNAFGSLEAINDLHRTATLEDTRYINPAKFPNTVSNTACGYVSIWEELRALNVTVSDGTPGALDAVFIADMHMTLGRAKALLVGGGEVMSEALWVAWNKLGMDPLAVPLAEGAALCVIEPLEAARGRGAHVLGVVAGYGSAFEAPTRRLLHPSPTAMERAIRAALDDARVAPAEVDLVVSGVMGISMFDDAELSAIGAVVGDAPVATSKRLLGETLGGAGAMSTAAALAWMAEKSPLPLVRGRAPERISTVLVTELGPYGSASALVLKAAT